MSESFVSAIMAAVGAHGMWKARLKSAISTGHLETPVDVIAQDNQCAFGKWLYGNDIPSLQKSSEQYRKVLALHALFHKTAAGVAELVLKGHVNEATAMIDQGAYGTTSGELTRMMLEWKNMA